MSAQRARDARDAAAAAAAARRASFQPAGTPAQGRQVLAGLRRDSPEDEGARRERSFTNIPPFILAAPTSAADADTAGGTAGLIPAADAAGASAGSAGVSAGASGASGASGAPGATATAALAADLPAGNAAVAPSLDSPAGDGNGGSEELPGNHHDVTFGTFLRGAIQRDELDAQTGRNTNAANQSARIRAKKSNDN